MAAFYWLLVLSILSEILHFGNSETMNGNSFHKFLGCATWNDVNSIDTFKPYNDLNTCLFDCGSTCVTVAVQQDSSTGAVQCALLESSPHTCPQTCASNPDNISFYQKSTVAQCPIEVFSQSRCVFRPSLDRMTRDLAIALCASHGATLPEADSLDDLDMIYASTNGWYAWLLADDLEVQGQYKWPNGASLNNSLWGPGEPNNVDERCTGVGTSMPRTVVDISCAWELDVVCMKDCV